VPSNPRLGACPVGSSAGHRLFLPTAWCSSGSRSITLAEAQLRLTLVDEGLSTLSTQIHEDAKENLMFSTPEEKAARALAKEQAKLEKDQQRAEEEFNASPAGQARAAFKRGDGWFEIELDVRNTGNLNPYGMTSSDTAHAFAASNKPKAGRTDALSQIENEGWNLIQANHVFVQLGEESRDKWASSGQRTSIRGKIVGIYVFKRRS
jgi:hypothetical protein